VAKKYHHKVHGFQIRYRVFLPDGPVVRYRFTSSSDAANEMVRVADILEAGSRRGDLHPRELQLAANLGLLSDKDLAVLSGGSIPLRYDLPKVMSRWRTASSVANTPRGHLTNLRRGVHLERWFEDNPIPTLTVADVKRYLHDRREGLLVYKNPRTKFVVVGVSAKTLETELFLMRMIIDEAVALGMVKSNVAREVDFKVKEQKFRRSFSADEIAAMIASAQKNRHMCHGQVLEVLLVALYTGMRLGEIRTLQWADVDLPARKIKIQAKAVPGEPDFSPKGGVANTTTIPDRLVGIFEGMERRGPWVFGGAKPIASCVFYKAFKVICQRAGLPKELTLHHARHTYGSWLLRMTGDLMYVMSEMRHADVSTTRNYLHSISTNTPAAALDFEPQAT